MRKNREIKFRVWDIKNKVWSKWVRENSLAPDVNLAADDNFVYQQFTELKDQEGKEIYDGDILAIDENKDSFPQKYMDKFFFEVCYFQLYGKWVLLATGIGLVHDLGDYYLKGKIVGNICENPELIK